ncbi:HIT family protein [Candidatus Shapirobacteria bacterium]|nr:HIT family protein [Candidatus Shapirobacteria bacterium]
MDYRCCDFCNEKIINKQKVYENDFIVAIYPEEPVIFYHLIVFPKRHIRLVSDLNKEELTRIFSFIDKIFKIFKEEKNCLGFNLISNNGNGKIGQHIPHAHFHLFLRFADEQISPYKVLSNISLREKLTQGEWKLRRKTISNYLKELR